MEKNLEDRMDDKLTTDRAEGRARGPDGKFLPRDPSEPKPGLSCPRCHGGNFYVITSWPIAGGYKRRRGCRACGNQWNTLEKGDVQR